MLGHTKLAHVLLLTATLSSAAALDVTTRCNATRECGVERTCTQVPSDDLNGEKYCVSRPSQAPPNQCPITDPSNQCCTDVDCDDAKPGWAHGRCAAFQTG